jgi:predicted CXXCH cytochrome family protein
MTQKQPTKQNTNATYGVPTGAGDRVATAIVFTNNTIGAGAGGFAMSSGTFAQGLCNACHTYKAADPNKMDNYYSTGYDGTHGTGVCTTCHKHSANTTNDQFAFKGEGTCTGCHAATAGSGADTFRDITGGTGDFSQASRHVFGATVSNFDCIVCHAEGDTSSSGTTILTTTQHNDASKTIAMRNVDAVGNPGASFVAPGTFGTWTNNFWQWPRPSVAPTANDHSNMDKFCMSCHDSLGATGINVNAAFTGLNLSNLRALTPFSKSTIGGSLTDFGARTRVLDVKTQFKNDATAGSNEWPAGSGTLPTTFDTLAEGQGYDGNPSQHAVLGPRYATKNASLAGWVTGKTLKSGQTLTTSEETSQLHCADCHSVDTNAHGSATANMLVAATVDNTCYTCHDSGVYSNTAGNGSRVDHSMCGHTFDGGMESTYGTSFCFNCHAGMKNESPYGGIHGMPSGTDPDYAASYTNGKNPIEERWRFMGGELGAYKQGAWPGAWNTSGTAPTCYMRTAANSYSNCSRHQGSGSGSKGSTNFNRELKY